MRKKLFIGFLSLTTSIVVGLFLVNLFNQKNQQLLNVGTGGTPPSAYSTTLSLGESSTDATINVNSVTAGDTTLTSALIYPGIFLTIEPQTASKREIVFCTGVSGTSFTGCTRGLTSVGDSISAVTANQQSHQAGVTIIASDPAQFYSYILVNRWNESWIYGKQHQASATSSDRTGFSLGNGQDVDIMLIFKDGTATATAPRLYRQESTGNLIWSGNGIDETTLSGGGASSTCGRGNLCEPVTGGHSINVATSTDTNSANLYGLSFITESGRDRLRLSGKYFGDFTLNNLFTSSTSASGTSYFSHLVPSANNAWDLGSPTSSWRGLYASGTSYLASFGMNFLPNLHASLNLGSYNNAWNNIFASGTLYAGNLNLSGLLSSSSTFQTDSIITYATSTAGIYCYYHQATSTVLGPLNINCQIPGGLMQPNSSIRVHVMGSSTRNAAGANVTAQVRYGGVNFFDVAFLENCKVAAPLSSCTTNWAGDSSINWKIDTIISNRNSLTSQVSHSQLFRYNEQNAATTTPYDVFNGLNVNTAVAQTLNIRLTSDNYSNSNTLGIEDLIVEVLNAR